MSSVAVFEAAIRVNQCTVCDKIVIENQKKEKNMKIKEIFT